MGVVVYNKRRIRFVRSYGWSRSSGCPTEFRTGGGRIERNPFTNRIVVACVSNQCKSCSAGDNDGGDDTTLRKVMAMMMIVMPVFRWHPEEELEWQPELVSPSQAAATTTTTTTTRGAEDCFPPSSSPVFFVVQAAVVVVRHLTIYWRLLARVVYTLLIISVANTVVHRSCIVFASLYGKTSYPRNGN